MDSRSRTSTRSSVGVRRERYERKEGLDRMSNRRRYSVTPWKRPRVKGWTDAVTCSGWARCFATREGGVEQGRAGQTSVRGITAMQWWWSACARLTMAKRSSRQSSSSLRNLAYVCARREDSTAAAAAARRQCQPHPRSVLCLCAKRSTLRAEADLHGADRRLHDGLLPHQAGVRPTERSECGERLEVERDDGHRPLDLAVAVEAGQQPVHQQRRRRPTQERRRRRQRTDRPEQRRVLREDGVGGGGGGRGGGEGLRAEDGLVLGLQAVELSQKRGGRPGRVIGCGSGSRGRGTVKLMMPSRSARTTTLTRPTTWPRWSRDRQHRHKQWTGTRLTMDLHVAVVSRWSALSNACFGS